MRKSQIILISAITLLTITASGILAFMLINFHTKKRQLPHGWLNISEPGDVYTMIIKGNTLYAGGKNGVWEVDTKTGRVIGQMKIPGNPTYIRALLLDSKKRLWIAHFSGIECVSDTMSKHFGLESGLPSVRVNTIVELKNGTIMTGTDKGVAIFNGKTWTVWQKNSKLLAQMVNYIYEDSQGNLWFGSYVAPAGGVSCLSANKWYYFNTENGLPHNNITAITEPYKGEIWVACGLYMSGGAAILREKSGNWAVTNVLHKKDGLIGEKVRSIYKGPKGRIWLGSEYDGITIITKNGTFRHLTVQDGLINPEAKCIIKDGRGNTWIGTREGLTSISEGALNKWLLRKK